MKTVSPISNPNPVLEVQRLLALQMCNPPKWGTISIKAVFHEGTCRRLEVKRKTSKQFDVKDGQQS
jgi:hypothetical protein